MMKKRTERKIEALSKDLHAMAREKAREYVDDVFVDVAAERIVSSFGDMLMKERAFEFCILYGKPKNDKERQEASKYIVGWDYKKYLSENPEKIKKQFKEFLKLITVRLSSFTTGGTNENQ